MHEFQENLISENFHIFPRFLKILNKFRIFENDLWLLTYIVFFYPNLFIWSAELNLNLIAQVVQYTFKLKTAERDGTPNKSSTSRETSSLSVNAPVCTKIRGMFPSVFKEISFLRWILISRNIYSKPWSIYKQGLIQKLSIFQSIIYQVHL